ncbi:MAG: helix-turn-helix domain-containing protein [Spirochaetaceae bacterium]|nr:helix-turn-helix domain-containing protein [Spirochaetaceae bacterium]
MRFEDIVFVYHLSDPGQIAWHGRDHFHGAGLFEMHYFVSGEGNFRNAAARYRIEPGTLYFSAPNMRHQILATEPKKPITYYALLIDVTEDREVAALLEDLLGRGEGRNIGTGYRFFFADILQKHLSKDTSLELSAQYSLMSFLYQLASGSNPRRVVSDNIHIEKAIAIMQTKIEGNLDLMDLCRKLGISREHFIRLFSAYMQMSPMRYYMRLKMEAACAMLSSTTLHIGEIADKLGFENQFSFSRTFKGMTGLSPRNYRDKFLQKVDFVVEKGKDDDI